MTELVTIDGFPLTGDTREGVWKRLGEIEGWFSSPDVKRNRAPRPRGPGSFRTKVEYDNRLITYNGRVTSKNHGYLHQAAGRITALGHTGPVKMLVSGHGPGQWATVDLRGSIVPTFPTDTRMEFQIPLEAIDPFKYGESHAHSGSLGSPFDVFQRGTVPAWPVVTVSGSIPNGYELTLNGRLVSVNRPVVSGSPHTVDMATGILRVGGSVARGGFEYSELLSIEPGLSQNFYSVAKNTGSGTVTVRHYDTYI